MLMVVCEPTGWITASASMQPGVTVTVEVSVTFEFACALARTSLKPEALLERVKRLEVELGREPTERWGPRVIDIDLITYGDVTLKTERLTLPHPELFNRAFVLVPLAEIAPDLMIAGVRVGDAAARLGAEAAEIVPLD